MDLEDTMGDDSPEEGPVEHTEDDLLISEATTKGTSSAETSSVPVADDVGKTSKATFEGKRKRMSSSSLDECPLDLDASPFDAGFVGETLLYCTLFPHDHEFDEDTLVQVWMALGFFVHEPMERFAGQFFDDCLEKDYFKFSRIASVTGKSLYKVTQKLYKLVQSSLVSLFKIFSTTDGITHRVAKIEDSSDLTRDSSEATLVSIRCGGLKKEGDLQGFERFKQLRALVFLHGYEYRFKQLPRNFILSLRELRVLDLSRIRVTELPTSISSMKCLRLLDLSNTLIKRLPEALGYLEKLQTLKLRGCLHISSLPQGIRKLVNLRHLDFDVFRQLDSMPEGLGHLINIQTLSAFLVGVEKGCSIRELENLNNISGSFCVSRLENVSTKDDAKEACLSKKTHIKVLEFHWSDSRDEGDAGQHEDVLSSLRPNTSLEEVTISCYGGLKLPSWICDPAFSNLVAITLEMCENCSELPALGLLGSLKCLIILDLHQVKVIDHRFYGNPGIQEYRVFPQLENLTLENMFSLEKWSEIKGFPRLLNLKVKHCPTLHNIHTLSSLSSLEELEIIDCPLLDSCVDGMLSHRLETFIIEDCPFISENFTDESRDWKKIAHIRQLWIDHEEIISLRNRSFQEDGNSSKN